jgi:Protein of unknown function (DUF3318)
MNSGSEVNRLIELMPASGRMYCKIVSSADLSAVLSAKLPRPGQEVRPIHINFDLWQQLSQPQRDLLLLRAVSWLTSIQWVKPEPYQGLVAVGTALTLLELLQSNAVGVVTLGGLTAFGLAQIWRQNRSTQVEIAADEKAVQVAQRRGYTQTEAAQALAAAIEAVAQIEGHPQLTFTEQLRCQNLKRIAAPAPVSPAEL